jgi:glucose-6-phosphate 1-dehydrogenase
MDNTITIFGATGNLMYKKLMPALVRLVYSEKLSKNVKIRCVGRKVMTNQEYKRLLYEKSESKKGELKRLFRQLSYHAVDFADPSTYKQLAPETKGGIYYLAVPPGLFPVIAKSLSLSGLVEKGNGDHRVVFEKPFGEGLESAKQINKELSKYLAEKQIYRIDHYLGKDMIQNVLVLRFTNGFFEHMWNKNFIERVTIVAKESETVMDRGNYYDGIGALKDMVQSHLMQLAALVAMEAPKEYKPDFIRQAKVKVLQQIKIDPSNVVWGQYKGYLKETHIPIDSITETFVFLKAEIDNPRWEGVPFYFMTGKALNEKQSEVRIQFKDSSNGAMFWPKSKLQKNVLVIRIAPTEGMTLNFNLKALGLSQVIQKEFMDYCHDCEPLGDNPEAYEKLILDIFMGNPTLFTSWQEVEAAWSIIHELREHRPSPYRYTSYNDLMKHVKSVHPEVKDEI